MKDAIAKEILMTAVLAVVRMEPHAVIFLVPSVAYVLRVKMLCSFLLSTFIGDYSLSGNRDENWRMYILFL